jgi:UDP-N-acetylglucosamine 2-epimerase
MHAQFIISDSGTAQEEPAIFKKPVIVPRDFSERPQSYNNNCSFKINLNKSDKSWYNSLKWLEMLKSNKIILQNDWLGNGKTSASIINILRKVL